MLPTERLLRESAGAGFTFTPTMAVILLGCGTGAVMCSWLLVCIRRRREPKHDPWDQLSQLFPHLVHGSSFKDAVRTPPATPTPTHRL